MRTVRTWILCVAVWCNGQTAPFENLTFDEPHTNAFVPNGFGEQMAPMADAIPGWTLEVRSDTFTGVYSGEVNALHVPHSLEPVVLLYPETSLFSPSYGFSLYFSLTGGQIPNPAMWFYQVGDIPAGAQQFSFLGGNLGFLINGQALPLTAGDQPYEKVVDISPWAGQTVKLEFYAPGALWALDIIGFSPVPEPSLYALLLLGLPWLAWRTSAARRGYRS